MRRAASLPSSARREEKRRIERRREETSTPQLSSSAHSCRLRLTIMAALLLSVHLRYTAAYSLIEFRERRDCDDRSLSPGIWMDHVMRLIPPSARARSAPPNGELCYSSCWAAQWKMKRPSSERFSEREKTPPPFEQVSLTFEVAYHLDLRFIYIDFIAYRL